MGGGDPNRDLSDWTRKGPLADLPRSNDRHGSGSDYSERRPMRDSAGADDGKVRDFGNWERRGPLTPLAPAEHSEGFREGSRARTMEGRSESFMNRKASPSWGPGEGQQEGSRPPRREFSAAPADRQERVVSAAEKDTQWRTSMRPDLAGKSPGQSREGSEAPSSPAASHAQPVGRPKLNLTKRTVSDAPNATSPALPSTDSKASPFGAARPIDTAAREREIEEKRVLAIQQKKEADEKAKEERRLAKEAAAKEAAEKEVAEKEAAEKAAAEKEAAEKEAAEKAAEEETTKAANGSPEAAHDNEEAATAHKDGEKKEAVPSREAGGEAGPAQPSRAVESGNWRRGSGQQRGGARGGHVPSGPRRGGGAPRGPRNDAERPARVNGSGAPPARQSQPASSEASSPAATDEDGWTTVPGKNRRGQNTRAPVSS